MASIAGEAQPLGDTYNQAFGGFFARVEEAERRIESAWDRDITAQSYADEFKAEYERQVLPVRQRAWNAAAELLLHHGRQLLRTSDNGHFAFPAFSTGLVAIGDPEHVGAEAAVPVICVSTTTGGASGGQKKWKDLPPALSRIDRKRTPSGHKSEALEVLEQWEGYDVRVGGAATDRRLLDSEEQDGIAYWREVVRPKARLGLLKRDVDPYTVTPDFRCWVKNNILRSFMGPLGDLQPYILDRPGAPRVVIPEGSNVDYAASLRKAITMRLEASGRHVKLFDLISLAREPLREMPYFGRLGGTAVAHS